MICRGGGGNLKLKYEAKEFLKILGPAVVFWFCFLSQFCFHSPQLFQGNRLSHFESVPSLVSDVILTLCDPIEVSLREVSRLRSSVEERKVG